MKKVCALALSILTTISATATDSTWATQTSVHLYNWYGLITPETPKAFQKETSARIVLDTFDSAETAQGRLMVGRFGYDVVATTSNILPGLVKTGVLQELDRNRLPHWKNLDADILGEFQISDPGNRCVVPYLWRTTGIAYDVDKIRKLLGPDAPVDSWGLVFREENISRLSQCGVATLDSPTEPVSVALNYLSLPYNSQNPEDYQKAQELLLKARPYIRHSDSSRIDTDLSNGNVYVVVGWRGTTYMAQVNDEQTGNGRHIACSIPQEGSPVRAENMILLKGTPRPQQGYALIDYLLRPEIIAKTSNYMGYPNNNQVALSLVEQELRESPTVYLSKEAMATLLPLETLSLKVEGIRTRVRSRVKTGSRDLSETPLEAREHSEPEKSSEIRQDWRSRPSPGEALPRPSGRGLPSDPRPIDRDTSPPGRESPGHI